MCIICVDYQKQLLTATEARRNMGEMVIDRGHKLEILLMLEEDEMDKLIVGGNLPTKKICDAPARYAFTVDVGSVPPRKGRSLSARGEEADAGQETSESLQR